MKPLNPKTLAALAGAAMVAVILVQPRPAARAGSGGDDWQPGEADAWADPEAAERYRDLDDRARRLTGRLTEKLALVGALVRGERTLDDVAARFRELNGPGRDRYGDLVLTHPAAGEEELAYRQVLGFVRMAVRAGRAVPVLERLEADLARRFPPAAS